MKVKVGNRIYDGENEPVMVILSKGDRENIANMLPEATKYCIYPSTEYWTRDDYKAIKVWMDREVDHNMVNPCSEVRLDTTFNPYFDNTFITWYEVTEKEIYNAMLVPGEYVKRDGKFYVKRGMLDGYVECNPYEEQTIKVIPIVHTD